MEFIHKDISELIIKAFYTVYNELGFGFSEDIYQNAMQIELNYLGLKIEAQKELNVFYQKNIVGTFKADFVVNNLVIVELKAVNFLADADELQILNYLKATNIELGLLMNFGKNAEIKRKIFSNSKKKMS